MASGAYEKRTCSSTIHSDKVPRTAKYGGNLLAVEGRLDHQYGDITCSVTRSAATELLTTQDVPVFEQNRGWGWVIPCLVGA